MFSKSLIASFLLFSAFAHAHSVVTPALGVNKSPESNDAQRSGKNPCGDIDIAKNIDTSSTVKADADGQFSVQVTNFTKDKDGSRKIIKMLVDTTGTGENFVEAGSIKTNGDETPTDLTSQSVVAVLAPGTKCSGGQTKNKCLVSMKTAGNFQNCVVLETQPDGTATASAGAGAASPIDTAGATAAAATSTGSTPPVVSPTAAADSASATPSATGTGTTDSASPIASPTATADSGSATASATTPSATTTPTDSALPVTSPTVAADAASATPSAATASIVDNGTNNAQNNGNDADKKKDKKGKKGKKGKKCKKGKDGDKCRKDKKEKKAKKKAEEEKKAQAGQAKTETKRSFENYFTARARRALGAELD